MVKEYGEIADMSPNGQVLVFKKSVTRIKELTDEKEFMK